LRPGVKRVVPLANLERVWKKKVSSSTRSNHPEKIPGRTRKKVSLWKKKRKGKNSAGRN